MDKLKRAEVLKDFIQEAVDRGATSVEQVHQYIADLPFEALESSGLLGDDKLKLRERQRRTIGMVYAAIRRINGEIGQLISDQFENFENAQAAHRGIEAAAMDESAPAAAGRKRAVRPPKR